MNATRKIALVTGVLFIITFITSIPADAGGLALDERTGDVVVTAMNGYSMPAGSDKTRWLRTWLRRWLPRSWMSQLLPPVPAPTTGMVTMLDLSRMSA